MSTNISKKLQNTQMEKTQKSRFSGCLLFTLCYLIANYSYIHLAPRSKEMQRSECPLAPLQWDVKLNLDDTEQDTYRTRKANPNFKSKQGKSKRKPRGQASKDATKVQGLQTNCCQSRRNEGSQRFTLGQGRNPELIGKHCQTDFKYRLQSTSLFLFGNGY